MNIKGKLIECTKLNGNTYYPSKVKEAEIELPKVDVSKLKIKDIILVNLGINQINGEILQCINEHGNVYNIPIDTVVAVLFSDFPLKG